MTVKIKGFREQPLLNPPGEDSFPGWLRILPEDERTFRNVIEHNRRQSPNDGWLEVIVKMRSLGVDVKPTSGELDLVNKMVARGRSGRKKGVVYEYPGIALAYHLRLAKSLGLPAEPTLDDVKYMNRGLKAARRKGNGGVLARMHDDMREAGVRVAVPASDVRLMEAAASESRRKGEASKLMSLLYHMRRLGLGGKPSEEDVLLIRGEMEHQRNFPWDGLPKALEHARAVMGEEAPQEAVQLPPLKTFRR